MTDSTKQAKAEKGLEPVAWMALCDGVGVQTAMDKEALLSVAKTHEWDVTPLYAHPPTPYIVTKPGDPMQVLSCPVCRTGEYDAPTQVEPVDARAVASILERLENDMCGSNARQDAADLIRKLIAHPPTQVEPVALRRAFSVLTDVLREIEGWEDKALPEAVAASRAELLTLIYAHPKPQDE